MTILLLFAAGCAPASDSPRFLGEWSSTDGILTFWEDAVTFDEWLYDAEDTRIGTATHEGDAWTQDDTVATFVVFCQYGNKDGVDSTDCEELDLAPSTDGVCRIDDNELQCDMGGVGMTFYP